jgi:cellulose synthase/poly-beta-1,6-N-acetylglucosamine synthase-like glycosyltransferase
VISVVVATHQRAALLPRLVDALEQQQGPPPFEVVLVDDGSADDTWATIERLAADSVLSIQGLRMPGQSGPAAARNAGWRAAHGRLIAFTDDDCVPRPEWLSTLGAALEEVELAQGCTLPDPAQQHLLGPFARTMEVRSETGYYQTCNVAYRRSTLEAVGGFDDDLRQAGEDIELATRALASGATTRFCAEAVVHHDVRPSSLRAHLRGTRRWAGIVLAVRKQPVLRERLQHGVVWQRSHVPAVAAAIGLVTMLTASRARTRLGGAAAVLPYVRHRLVVQPLPHTEPSERLALLPQAFVADLAEVGVLAAASARYRCLVL